MTKSVTTLDDKYQQETGRVFMNANQALVRLPLDQARRDLAAGLKTTGYISGYRGSPLGVYDAALWAAQGLLDQHNVRFQPGLNEELAATAIRGTQELEWFGASQYQGVFGLWYGKGLGTDRACESLKLGNLEGSSRHGGVLVVSGDDHGGKSSASAHQSEHTLMAGFLPILYPSTITEILEYGVFGWALSRYSGLYVGLKTITDTLDLSGTVELPDVHRRLVTPDHALPPEGLNLRPKLTPLVQEEWVVNHRLPAALAFARANGIDRTVIDGPNRMLSIVAAGKAFLDLRQALTDLGLDEARCRQLGIRVYKPGMIWPLERENALAFAERSRALLVVEEKRPVMEDQLARHLYGVSSDRRPGIAGKFDLHGAPLLPQIGELTPAAIRHALVVVLEQLGLVDGDLRNRARRFEEFERHSKTVGGSRYRPAFYCSGCPHNTSTKIPDGSTAISAVGCHGLAAYVMPERRTMQPMPMGGDGMPWVSVGPLVTDMQHIFQNVGDGTYSHSGVLSIRAAVAAKARMTFKILYNDAVAMTGGQPVEAAIGPLDVVRQLVAENVRPVLLVSDTLEKYEGVALPAGVRLHHRDEMDRLQRELRELEGVSAIVYEQTCATEKRRRRKRGKYPVADKRVFINPEVCEGCGDCSSQSNCVSITPLETPLGRKRAIDQSTCNMDYSCTRGFCPSFVTVTGAQIAKQPRSKDDQVNALIAKLPAPAEVSLAQREFNMLVAGIGGTGVLTVGALLGMAAHLEGKSCLVLDMTGMAQKGGAVTSHLRIGRSPEQIHNARLGAGMTDVLLACDMIVASGREVLKTVRAAETRAVLNADVTPTGEFQTHPDIEIGEGDLTRVIHEALAGGECSVVHGTALAKAFIGDSIATNVLMLGYAAQKGWLPVSIASLESAIRLNGTFVEGNLRTFALGRVAAHAPQALQALVDPGPSSTVPETLEAVVASRRALLEAYQDASYAERYVSFIRSIEKLAAARVPGRSETFVREAALTLARLMAYKDEYEVARLHTDEAFQQRLKQQFAGDFKLTFHLAPPLLPGRDSATGQPKKRAFGAWVLPVFRTLKRFKGLRGTWFDPFGHTAERRMERSLIEEYRALIQDVVGRLNAENLDTAIELARAAARIRGYGHVKLESVEAYRVRRDKLITQLRVLAPAKAGRKSIPIALKP